MELPHDSVLLRIFIGESDRHGGHPLHEAIVLQARELHLAGATVLGGGMVTLEKVRVIHYRAKAK